MLARPELNLIGRGLYTVPEASRLSNVSPARIRRWLRGYRYKAAGETRWSKPVWHGELPEIDGAVALSFLDLMDARFVDAFRKYGVPWKTIRLAADRSREIFNVSHPFAAKRFMTDGRRIFAEIFEDTGTRKCLDMVRNQYAFRQVVSPSFVKSLEFSRNGGEAIRWWPLGKDRMVVVDPERCFGQPITGDSGVPTEVLANACRVEKSVERVARIFDVPPRSVKDAVRFEESLAA